MPFETHTYQIFMYLIFSLYNQNTADIYKHTMDIDENADVSNV